MEFSEKQLVDIFWENELWGHYPFSNRIAGGRDKHKCPKAGKITASREFSLASGRRCDLFIRNKTGREFWVVEFKVEANVDSIIQLREYFDEIKLSLLSKTSIFVGAMAIAAQYFHPHTVYFATALGIKCLQVAPINGKQVTITELNEYELEDDLQFKINHERRYRAPQQVRLEAVNG